MLPILSGGRRAALGLCLLLQAAIPGAVLAQEADATVRTGRNVYLAGGQVRPSAPVAGDLSAAGGRIVLEQPVGGDAALVAGSVEVRAAIADDLRAIGGDVKIAGPVAGEVFATGGNVALAREASAGRGARLYGANVTVDGRIDGPLRVGAQRVVLNGAVNGDVSLTAGEVELGPAARITGTLAYTAADFRRADGAVVTGPVTRSEAPPPGAGPQHRGMDRPMPRHAEGGWSRQASWGGSVSGFVATLAFLALFLGLAPRFVQSAAAQGRREPLLATGLGFALFLAVPLACMLLFITLLGIPVAMLVMGLFPLLLLAGFGVGVLIVAILGRRAAGRAEPTTFGGRLGHAALALVLVLLLARVPLLGGLLLALLTLGGLGALVLEVRARRRDRAGPGPGSGTGLPAAVD